MDRAYKLEIYDKHCLICGKRRYTIEVIRHPLPHAVAQCVAYVKMMVNTRFPECTHKIACIDRYSIFRKASGLNP